MSRFITKADVLDYLGMFFEEGTNFEQEVMKNAHLPEFYLSEGLFPRVQDAQLEFMTEKLCRPDTTESEKENEKEMPMDMVV